MRTTGCPCGRTGTFGGTLPYEQCCGRYLDDPQHPAPDAESLMRSRYTAYVRSRADYLLATWDPGTRPERLRLDPRIRWDGLDLRGHRTRGEDRAEVEFVARFTEPAGRTGGGGRGGGGGGAGGGGRGGELHERSRFVRRDGRWFYVDGDVS